MGRLPRVPPKQHASCSRPSSRAEGVGRTREEVGESLRPGAQGAVWPGGLDDIRDQGFHSGRRAQRLDPSTVVLSGACHNRVPQAAGFRDPLPALEVTSLKSRCGQGHALSQGSRGGSFLPLPDSGGSGHSWVCGHLPPTCATVFTWLLLCV